LAECVSNCVDEQKSLEVFGSLTYAADSAICLSAFHSGALGPSGGDV